MKRLVFVALGILGWAIVTTGCATLIPREGEVAVSLVSIRPLQSTLFESSAELTLRYTNETPHPLTLVGSTHKLYINGTYVGRAVTNEGLTIAQLGTKTQTMTAHIENLALMRKAQELGNVPTVDYRIDSRLHATSEQGGGTLAATATGHLDLSGLLPADLAQPRAQ